MGNCTVKGTTVNCSVIGVACDGGAKAEAIVPENIKDAKLEAPKRVKDIIASAQSPASCKVSGSTGRAKTTAAFKNLEVLPSPEKGVWRVRTVISSEQLAEILSEQANTEAMIERMRTYAASAAAAQKQPKCKRAAVADWMTHCEQVLPF